MATKVGAVVFATSGRIQRNMWVRIADERDSIRTVNGSSTRCYAEALTFTLAARPTEPAAAACTAWDAAAADDARAREPAR